MASYAQTHPPGPGSGAPSSSSSSYPLVQPRSCVTCRQRKIKCDRQQPCSNCTRSRCECVYPLGRGRAPKRPRPGVDAQLTEKLTRLENIIQRMAAENEASKGKRDAAESPQGQQTLTGTGTCTTGSNASPQANQTSPAPSTSIEGQLSRLVINDEKSYYVSNPIWATLTAEIDEMRGIIAPMSDDEDDHDSNDPSDRADLAPNSASTNAALFGFRSTAHSLRSFHPPLTEAMALFTTFTTHVAPLMPIFHLPTLTSTYYTALANLDSLDRDTEALLFAIYYAALISLPATQIPSRTDTLDRHRFATEQALARADLLNTQSLPTLQALVLFLSALRNQDASRTAWSLNTLAYHIARAMGLHRDGSVFGLKPLDTELRRRLWWNICILDGRSSASHGFQPLIHMAPFDVRKPLNVLDEDLTMEMESPPAEREEATDLMFLLIRCEASDAAVKLKLLSPDEALRPGGAGQTPLSRAEKMEVWRELEARLNEKYLTKCRAAGSDRPMALLSLLLARLLLSNFWLVMSYPLRGEAKATSPPDEGPEAALLREQIYQKAVEVLGIMAQLLETPALAQWVWYMRTHIQWHSIALVLSELCSGRRSPGDPEWEKGWHGVMRLHSLLEREDWGGGGGLGAEKRGLMWKGVRRLMAQAKAIRERWMAGATTEAAADQSSPWGPAGRSMSGMDFAAIGAPLSHFGYEQRGSLGAGVGDPWMNSMLAMPLDPEMEGMLGPFGSGVGGFAYQDFEAMPQESHGATQGSGLPWNGW